MSSPLTVRIVASAAEAISEAAEWWVANRPKAPNAFRDDFEAALKLIASHPGAGTRSGSRKVKE